MTVVRRERELGEAICQSCQSAPCRHSSLEISGPWLSLGRDTGFLPRNVVVPGPRQDSSLPGPSSVSLRMKAVLLGLQASDQKTAADSRDQERCSGRTFPVVQWLRILPPMQGTQFDPWSQRITHATKKLSVCVTTTELVL